MHNSQDEAKAESTRVPRSQLPPVFMFRHALRKPLGCEILFRRNASINYLVEALGKGKQASQGSVKPDFKNSPNVSKTTAKPQLARGAGVPKDLTSAIITPNALNDIFRHPEYSPPSPKQLTETQSLFNRAAINLEWTYADYEEIPDIKYQRLHQKRLESYDRMDPYNKTEYDENVAHSKKSFGIKPELLRPLPEILLLGHTNVGKSSLINNLVLNKLESRTAGAKTEYAYVSKRAGYTKTLNCYNVGNKFRLIDSPGYGEYAESKQGKVVIDYLERRDLLRRVYLLIDSVEGFRDEDLQLINHLIEVGVPFEVVFTKADVVIAKHMPKKSLLDAHSGKQVRKVPTIDKVEVFSMIQEGNAKVIDHFNRLVDGVHLRDLVTMPRILFNNTSTNKYVTMRYGYKELRCLILESCGLISENGTPLIDEEEDLKRNKSRRTRNVREVSREE